MAVHPLRPATDRRFGRPLPCQLPNQTRDHPVPPEFFTLHHAVLCAYAVLTVVSNWYPPEQGRFPTRYSPVRHSVQDLPSEDFRPCTSFDLHVLSTPPAFILSQDLTDISYPFYCLKVSSLNKTFQNFQGCFTVQLSRCSVLLPLFLSGNFDIISLSQSLVNNFLLFQKLFSESI